MKRAPLDQVDAGGFDPVAERSRTLPADWYTNPDVFALEKERVFMRSWWYLCHASALPEVGSYYAGTILNQPVFAVRSEDGGVRSFFNACSHRAYPLLEGAGRVKRVVCPYHRWCFSLRGELIGAPGTRALPDFDAKEEGLSPLATHVFGGLVFVNVAGPEQAFPEDMTQMLEEMTRACPSLERYQLQHQFTKSVKANWKVVVDNHLDNDHVKTVHHQYHVQDVADALWLDHSIGMTHVLQRTGTDRRRGFFNYIWPNTVPMSFMEEEHLLIGQFIPLAVDRCELRYELFGLGDTLSAAMREKVDYLYNKLYEEDVAACEALQRGLNARGYRQGRLRIDHERLDYSEHHIHRFQALVASAMTLQD